ncbi:hypothetical protein EMMF5_003313 [Cystobasidiomycetes sp. EMM_F5]
MASNRVQQPKKPQRTRSDSHTDSDSDPEKPSRTAERLQAIRERRPAVIFPSRLSKGHLSAEQRPGARWLATKYRIVSVPPIRQRFGKVYEACGKVFVMDLDGTLAIAMTEAHRARVTTNWGYPEPILETFPQDSFIVPFTAEYWESTDRVLAINRRELAKKPRDMTFRRIYVTRDGKFSSTVPESLSGSVQKAQSQYMRRRLATGEAELRARRPSLDKLAPAPTHLARANQTFKAVGNVYRPLRHLGNSYNRIRF